MIRWPGKVPAGTVENGIMSGLDWFPTFLAAAGNPNIKAELLKGKKIGDRTYKNHLDSYDQTAMITGKGPSARHEIYYFGESTLGAVRIDDWKYRFIDQAGRVSSRGPNLAHFFSDLIGHPQTLLEMVKGFESGVFLHPPKFFLDHMPKAYAIWTWNDYEAHG